MTAGPLRYYGPRYVLTWVVSTMLSAMIGLSLLILKGPS